MSSYWGVSNDVFDQSYRSLRTGVLVFGGFLVALGFMIFLFPKLIAFLLASFILLVGLSLLAAGIRIWMWKNSPRPFEWRQSSTRNSDADRESITFIFR